MENTNIHIQLKILIANIFIENKNKEPNINTASCCSDSTNSACCGEKNSNNAATGCCSDKDGETSGCSNNQDQELTDLKSFMKLNKQKFNDLIIELGTYLTNSEVMIRVKAMKTLCAIIRESDLIQNFEPIVEFLASRSLDKHCIRFVLQALIDILNRKKVNTSLLTPIFTLNITKQPQDVRHMYLKLLYLIAEELSKTDNIDKKFIELCINSIDGEKDPRNLLVSFELTYLILEKISACEYEITELSEDLFTIVSCYFPVNFTTPNDTSIDVVYPEILSFALRKIFLLPHFAYLSLPILMEKMDSSLNYAKIDGFKTLFYLLPTCPTQHLLPHVSDLWDILRREIMVPASKKVACGVVSALTELRKRLNNEECILKKLYSSMSFGEKIADPKDDIDTDEDNIDMSDLALLCLCTVANSLNGSTELNQFLSQVAVPFVRELRTLDSIYFTQHARLIVAVSFTSIWSNIVNLVNIDVLSKLESATPSQVLSIMDLLYGFMLASNNCKIEELLKTEWAEVFNRALFSGFPTSRAMAANSIALLFKEDISVSLVNDILAFVLENEDPLFQRAISVIGIDISNLLLEKLFNSIIENDFENISKLILSNSNTVTKALIYISKIQEQLQTTSNFQLKYLELIKNIIENIYSLNFTVDSRGSDSIVYSLFNTMVVFLKLGVDSSWVNNFVSISSRLVKVSSPTCTNQYLENILNLYLYSAIDEKYLDSDYSKFIRSDDTDLFFNKILLVTPKFPLKENFTNDLVTLLTSTSHNLNFELLSYLTLNDIICTEALYLNLSHNLANSTITTSPTSLDCLVLLLNRMKINEIFNADLFYLFIWISKAFCSSGNLNNFIANIQKLKDSNYSTLIPEGIKILLNDSPFSISLSLKLDLVKGILNIFENLSLPSNVLVLSSICCSLPPPILVKLQLFENLVGIILMQEKLMMNTSLSKDEHMKMFGDVLHSVYDILESSKNLKTLLNKLPIDNCIDNFLSILSWPNSTVMIKIMSCNCLEKFSFLPIVKIFKHKANVTLKLTKYLDEPKRAVRKAAAKCRNQWMIISNSSNKN